MSGFIFLSPWVLGALAALPALWFLLRVMPPAPKRIFLPSARFLEGLVPKTQTPSKTPWWILILRLVIAAFLITALAQPVLNPAQQLQSNNAIRLIIDNGWSSAHLWDTKIRTAEDYLAQADRRNVSVYLNTTAQETSDGKPIALGPLSANEALSRLKGFTPQPWPSDFETLNQNIKTSGEDIDSIFLSDGIDAKNIDDFITTLKDSGDVKILTPKPENLPVLLGRGKDKDGNPGFILHSPFAHPSLQAIKECRG